MPAFAVVLYLAQLLAVSFKRVFVLVLDKLFLNIDVAHVLLVLDVATSGAARKKLPGFLPILLRSKNILCFVWQGNNAVLGLMIVRGIPGVYSTS